ncbi:MAG TPA: hypothetical protein VGQ07_07130 [Nitrospirales bacterium]|jgi:hypothetical protein|nr:hypothetical protein [Nitrospirales bacterium]
MLEIIQSVHVLAGVFVLTALAILLVFGFRGLCWPKALRSNDRQAYPHYAQLLRKMPF